MLGTLSSILSTDSSLAFPEALLEESLRILEHLILGIRMLGTLSTDTSLEESSHLPRIFKNLEKARWCTNARDSLEDSQY